MTADTLRLAAALTCRPHFPAETDTYAPQTGQARVSSTGGWRGADGPAPDAGCAGERRLVVGGGLPADPLKALAESGYVEQITKERGSRNARSVSTYA